MKNPLKLALKSIPVCLLTALSAMAPADPVEHGHEHGPHEEEHANRPGDTDHHGEHEDHGAHGDHREHHDEERVRISPQMADRFGITLEEATSGLLQRTLKVYGEVTVPPGRVSRIRARYQGLITTVHRSVGDAVEAGDLLIEIESNESLKKYTIKAPIAGVITRAHANVGEATGNQDLFVIANFETLWAELKLFPQQRQVVAPGQPVTINGDELLQSSEIQHVLPLADGRPYVVARAVIDNRDNRWFPGALVAGLVAIETIQVPLTIDNRALQTIAGTQVVFVREGDHFEARPVELGRTDHLRSEVRSGLAAGERYAVANSYLIKADIEKSGAEHHH